MSEYKNIAGFFEEKGPEDIERFVDKNLDITEQVYALLEENGWSQKDLAQALGKTDAEVSKWLSGMHNLTLRSIAKMEAALGADIILTPKKASERYERVRYVKLTVHSGINQQYHGRADYRPSQPKVEREGDEALKIKVA